MFDSLFQDIRYGIRALAARPGFTLAALLTLALAIGANTLVFSLIDGIYLSPLPYREDAELIDIENQYRNMGLDATGASIPDYFDRREMKSIVESTLYAGMDFNLALDGAPERAHGIRATPSLFATLGVAPALGRAFTEDEAAIGARKTVVLSDALWRNRFGADPKIVGTDIRLNGEPYTVVGVMPPGFEFPQRTARAWKPEIRGQVFFRQAHFMRAVARLAPGATVAEARAELARVAEVAAAAGGEAAFSSVLDDASVLLDPRRLERIALYSLGWGDDAAGWAKAVRDFRDRSAEILGSVKLEQSSDVALLARNADLKVTVSNALPWAVTVRVTADPQGPLLRARAPKDVTIEPESTGTARIPVEAIANGEVTVLTSLTSPTGVPLDAGHASVTVRAEWEGIGTLVVVIVLVLIFAAGIVRLVVIRRRARREAATDAEADLDEGAAHG